MVIVNKRMWRFTGKVCQSWPSATISCQSKCEKWTLLCRFDCQKIFEVILTWKVVQQDFWQTWKSASREEKAADFPWLDICTGFTMFFPLFNFCTPWLTFAPGLQNYFQLLIEYESLAQVMWAEISGTRYDFLGRLFLSAKAPLPWSVVFSLCSTVHNSRWGQR